MKVCRPHFVADNIFVLVQRKHMCSECEELICFFFLGKKKEKGSTWLDLASSSRLSISSCFCWTKKIFLCGCWIIFTSKGCLERTRSTGQRVRKGWRRRQREKQEQRGYEGFCHTERFLMSNKRAVERRPHSQAFELSKGLRCTHG